MLLERLQLARRLAVLVVCAMSIPSNLFSKIAILPGIPVAQRSYVGRSMSVALCGFVYSLLFSLFKSCVRYMVVALRSALSALLTPVCSRPINLLRGAISHVLAVGERDSCLDG